MEHHRPFRARQISRRRLFELGGMSAGVAALLAGCGNDEPPAPGRVGNAAPPPELEPVEVNDVVLLRTLTSLEHSIVEVYASLAEIEGVDGDVTAVLARFTDDHTTAAAEFAELTTASGGESFECANPWLMRRTLQPVIDNIVGSDEIEPSDDPTRDTLRFANVLETIATATSQQFVELLSEPALRSSVIAAGAQSARRAATIALHVDEAPERYVLTELIDGEEVAPDEEGFVPVFAIPSRFGQLVPIELRVGALNERDQRFTTSIETPADNAYVYEGESCES